MFFFKLLINNLYLTKIIGWVLMNRKSKKTAFFIQMIC